VKHKDSLKAPDKAERRFNKNNRSLYRTSVRFKKGIATRFYL